MNKLTVILLALLLSSCFHPQESPSEKNIHFSKSTQKETSTKKNNRWTYYSRAVTNDDPQYKLPKRTAYSAKDLFQKMDLEKIQSWKQIYVQTRKKYPSQSYDDSEYQLFKKDFFEQKLSLIHDLYLKHYTQKDAWTEKSPKINENSFKDDFTFVEKLTIPDKAKLAVIGDLHSGFHSLLQFIFDLEIKGFFEEGKLKLRKDRHILFLGDMVDRGPYGLEILLFVFYLKQLNFDQVHINNGNHEDYSTFSRYGLTEEVKGQFGIDMKTPYDYPFLMTLLQSLPSAFYLKFRGKTYHFSHGVVSPEYAGANSSGFFDQTTSPLKEFLSSNKKFDHVHSHRTDNFKWSDCSQTNESGMRMQSPTRGSHKIFTYDFHFIRDYLKFHNLTAIIRGHQDKTNLGLIRPTFNEEEETVFIDKDKTFELYEGRYPEIFWEPTNAYNKISLEEKRDFLVVTTSSASIARKIDTAYLILQ